MPRLTTAALCLLIPATFACAPAALSQTTPDAATQAAIAHARDRTEAMTRALAALPHECMLGNGAQDGAWVLASHGAGEPTVQLSEVHSFDAPIETRTFQLVLDRQGWKQLDHVEVRDADGTWQPAWSGPNPAAPARCDFVRLRQVLAREVKASAVRLVFRREVGEFTAGDVGVLPVAQR